MKLSYLPYLSVASVVLLLGCDKTLLENNIRHTMSDPTKANLKIVHAYAGKAPALTAGAGPNLFMYLGTQKLTGAAMTYAAVFWPSPSTVAGNIRSLYAQVPAGTNTLRGVLARVAAGVPAPAAGDTVFTGNVNLEPGKYYTAFLTDTAPTPRITLAEDLTGGLPKGKFRIRFANMSAWPDDRIEVYSKREDKVIFSNVTYKQVTPFIELNTPTLTDTLTVRKVSGSSPGTYTLTLNGFRGQALRGYTLFTRGKQPTGTSAVFQNITLHMATDW